MHTGFFYWRCSVALLSLLLLPFILTAAAFAEQHHAWAGKSIIPGDHFIWAVGHSSPQQSEQLARDEAFSNALKEFSRYCKATVNAYDRSIETYGVEKGKHDSSQNIDSQNSVLVKASVSGAVADDWFIRKEGSAVLASVLLKIPKKEYERISQENNPARVSLDILFYHEDAQGRMQTLSDGSVLRSGDGYALYVQPDNPCYLYVYQVDQLGKAYRLFPNEQWETLANPLPGSTGCWLPNSSDLFVLDETTGKEFFFVFASRDKIKEFENGSGATLTRKDLASAIAINKMGVARLRNKKDKSHIVPPKRKTTDVIEIKKKLQADGAFVYETWFWHQQ